MDNKCPSFDVSPTSGVHQISSDKYHSSVSVLRLHTSNGGIKLHMYLYYTATSLFPRFKGQAHETDSLPAGNAEIRDRRELHLPPPLVGSNLNVMAHGDTRVGGGEVKGKLANAVGSHYSSHYLRTWCIQHYYR